ncbi:DUF5988 family protein [Dactylosporangium sp. NBC_01737]|uniref:DUF5988 family protein n=1 Tax=Dactylosporangium sp. NBC_01737 TaxID=2975959 RepID=UPI002E0E3BD1|nr:DUF5988 family protein [Dactylosporangium sp. NBC_01737]
MTTVNGEDDLYDAFLEGGPRSIEESARFCRTPVDTTKIKLPHRNGYEHFELVREPAPEAGPALFRWTGRTKIAE